MVGIAQPENFSTFLRKVGYSVGLENTLKRFSEFCEAYASTPQYKISDWTYLVHEQWGLKTNNIADVFSSLGIVEVNGQGVFAGPFGESGAICARLLDDEEERIVAYRHLLALSIVLADGDVFINCLAAGFDSDKAIASLVGMVLGKRQELFEVFKSQAEREAISGAITIERQRSNKGGASKGSRLAGGLSSGLAGGLSHLGLPKPKDVYYIDPPSRDYLRHVIPSRREWARSLGLLTTDGEISPQGWRWLECTAKQGFLFASGEYSLRPTKFELEKNRLSAVSELYERSPTTWDYVSLVSCGLAAEESHLPIFVDDEKIAALTFKFFEAFRDFSQDRRMIRNELPLMVALSAYMAISRAKGDGLINYDSWLRSDVPQKFGIKTRSSRIIELGLIISRYGKD